MVIFYTDRFVPKGAAGCSRGPFIFIRPKYKEDRGLLAHEKVHVRQSWRGLILGHALMYFFVPSYRLQCEVEAYREQLKWYPDDRCAIFSRMLAKNYNLAITEEMAMLALRS